jgi:hypothetical protein
MCIQACEKVTGQRFSVYGALKILTLLNSFFNQLTAVERQHGYFQQDNTTTHTAKATMVAIQEVSED